MSDTDPVDILNELVVLHHRSLPMYLRYASPTWHQGDEQAREVLQAITADHERIVDEAGEMIVEMDSGVSLGGFPMKFTSYHDLSFDFLLQQMRQEQDDRIAALQQCVAKLEAYPRAKALAQEALGAARRHKEMLDDLAASRAAGSAQADTTQPSPTM